MAKIDYQKISFHAGAVFTPGSPINEKDLFAGRKVEIARIIDAISQRGQHAILFGERGVGKTSLANILAAVLQDHGQSVIFPKTNCDPDDQFSDLWRRVLGDIEIEQTKTGLGFGSADTKVRTPITAAMPQDVRPDDVRRVLAQFGTQALMVICIDEFDRLKNRSVSQLMSDTIKNLSDNAVPATILLIGVGESVDNLIDDHQSVERSLIQVPMPRMSPAETKQIINNGLGRLGMTIRPSALNEIADLSQGLPYVTHLLGLYSARTALASKKLSVEPEDVREGIGIALDNWNRSIISAYYDATKSQQPGHLYKEVLLACALAEPDEKNFFTAAAVRRPLQLIARPDLDIPNFARHLKEFSDDRRGNILTREGGTRRLRYRFVSPLMRPYIVMRGVAEGLVTQEKLAELRKGKC